ncbi:MAG: hypothetical protein ACOX5F_07905 [Anaerovoracaceae bacterium]
MDITITLGDAILLLISLALLVLIIYCIILVKNLIPTIKNLARITEDTQRITGIAADSAQGAQKIVNDLSTSVSGVAEALKGNQNMIASLTNLVKALGSLKSFADKKAEKTQKN